MPVAAGRYAPSPSGDLHLGNLRTAVVGWLMARATGRRFLLRIEDLDVQRSSAAAARRQRADLAALGLSFDPPTLIQSERLERYRSAIAALGPDRVYECFCTRREIRDAVRAPHAQPGWYPGTCAELTRAERAERRRERPAALRVRAEGARESVHDLWRGELTGIVDDFVLQRNDGTPAYNLAVVVDDAESGVDQVVRGADLAESAPRQAWLARQLGWSVPSYAHIGLALNPSGQRLAKRDGAVTLAALAEAGIGPAKVLNRIAASLQLADEGEQVTLQQLAERFDPDAVPLEPWVVEAGPR